MEIELPLIITQRLLLRMATQEDIPEIIQYFTENKTYFTPFYPRWADSFFTEEYWQLQLELNFHEFRNDLSLRLFLFLRDNPRKIIGTINFSNFVRGVAQYCNLGYGLAEAEQGKGYMTEALQAAIAYIFKELNMHRVMANYMPHNQRSGNLLKRLGFVVEGYARNYLLIDGQWQDHILTSLTNPNWQAR
ncbi:alanine acetyltransferase [Fischerella major NIES-592]|uniref:Alanine acetyltransferase n=2 Tax=Fischerella TaxID=1190 RepID=A0A1U7GYC9_9CYAN|nr:MULTISPECIES: ribosomal protein S5-alanine N-acetyltransferase [Fischerella]OKH13470.1 alanine acetyltransferase [Fischerella major NIES-592]PMB43532.1 30S ribosomal protein S5 alanine N-acetyltransferase [Fischerella thermalis CCMEE 5330]BCX09369.1 MAG: ribosomal-protein-alanine N-acetyltransferase [Fischerella sp.]